MESEIQMMDPADVKIAFKCPGCLRRQETEFEGIDLALDAEPCEEHGMHMIVSIAFTCPNCNTEVHVESVGE
jgi:predicted RNA-binding Zn-ribbon protein involved in translation (DUF1610 family)